MRSAPVVLTIIICCSVFGNVLAQKKDTLKGAIKISKSPKNLSVSIAGKSGGKITVEEFCLNPIIVNPPDWKVVEFSVRLVIKEYTINKQYYGCQITNETCSLLSGRKEVKVYIENIIASNKKTGARGDFVLCCLQ